MRGMAVLFGGDVAAAAAAAAGRAGTLSETRSPAAGQDPLSEIRQAGPRGLFPQIPQRRRRQAGRRALDAAADRAAPASTG